MNTEIETVSALEFISRVAGCLVANAVITATTEEYTDKKLPTWAVLPYGRCCSPMTYIAAPQPRWWQWRAVAEYGTANHRIISRLTRAQARLVLNMVAEAQYAFDTATKNPWATVDM
jgi:hypothetical protein